MALMWEILHARDAFMFSPHSQLNMAGQCSHAVQMEEYCLLISCPFTMNP